MLRIETTSPVDTSRHFGEDEEAHLKKCDEEEHEARESEREPPLLDSQLERSG